GEGRARQLITSRDNERLKLVRKLHDRSWRDKLGLLVVEGEDLVAAAGVEPVDLLRAGEDVEPKLLAEVSALAHPPRVVAVYRRDDLPRGVRPMTLALWRVADPGNVGTLLRAADAFGAGVALSAGCADPTSPKALRASMGAIFRVPLSEFDEPAGRRVALVPRGGTPLPEVAVDGEVVLVLGAEREGLPEDVLARCDEQATIPQAGPAESLNVAMAGAIALYELARRP
ncbi:MAG: RNA methyltransferase, partial [Actinobacteria bacterium]|nr:RNA methyltransferase [Actinomycetota bacterium]